MNLSRLKQMIRRHEGIRKRPYKDSLGKWTIGVGHLLEHGLSCEEAVKLLQDGLLDYQIEWLLDRDVNDALRTAMQLTPAWDRLDEARKMVLADMAFNLGPVKLAKFRRMFRALADRDFDVAADEMIDSRWYRQVGQRGERLQAIMRTGILPEQLA